LPERNACTVIAHCWHHVIPSTGLPSSMCVYDVRFYTAGVATVGSNMAVQSLTLQLPYLDSFIVTGKGISESPLRGNIISYYPHKQTNKPLLS
jgi:hypothetical protein